jgi:nucleoid DNA-binding protein
MKQNDLVQRLASTTQTTPGAAADQLEQIVHDIIQALKEGRSAALPGLGTFTPADSKPGFRFEADSKRSVRPRGRK